MNLSGLPKKSRRKNKQRKNGSKAKRAGEAEVTKKGASALSVASTKSGDESAVREAPEKEPEQEQERDQVVNALLAAHDSDDGSSEQAGPKGAAPNVDDATIAATKRKLLENLTAAMKISGRVPESIPKDIRQGMGMSLDSGESLQEAFWDYYEAYDVDPSLSLRDKLRSTIHDLQNEVASSAADKDDEAAADDREHLNDILTYVSDWTKSLAEDVALMEHEMPDEDDKEDPNERALWQGLDTWPRERPLTDSRVNVSEPVRQKLRQLLNEANSRFGGDFDETSPDYARNMKGLTQYVDRMKDVIRNADRADQQELSRTGIVSGILRITTNPNYMGQHCHSKLMGVMINKLR